MRSHSPDLRFENILNDALVRLVMASDGVSEAELRLVLENARRAVVARDLAATIARRTDARTRPEPGRCIGKRTVRFRRRAAPSCRLCLVDVELDDIIEQTH